ncbi:MAG: hypothetical protein OEZ51_03535 [Nitrospinota bacterium]|nr:hypothetical protein [Nitrospinota bacterium]
MNDRLEMLLEKFRTLERELAMELQKKQEEFFYEVHRKKVRFQRDIKLKHRQLMQNALQYIREARPMAILTLPVIWACLIPALLLDLAISIYQAICFPVYGIPKVRRGDYIVLDRHNLSYLNAIEKLNCMYCGYFNGLVAYAREMAARTEQHWCPIKHARRVGDIHSRYKYFFDYGDAKRYRQEIETVRREFEDIKQ